MARDHRTTVRAVPADPPQHATEVAEGVVAIVHGRGETGVSNAGLVHDEGRALVIDTMMFPEMAEGIAAEVRRRGARADVVLNTHHHVDHVGGNAVFDGARLVAHPKSADAIAHPPPAAVYDSFIPAYAGRFESLDVVPPEPSLDGLDLPRDARLRSYAPAHTVADVAVWLPPSRVLFTGDLAFFGVTPLAFQGLVSSWVAALDDLLALDPAVVVPGHGPVGGTRELVLVRDHLAALLAAARDDTPILPDEVGEWLEADRIPVNLERARQEVRGEIDAADLTAIPANAGTLFH